MPPRNTTSTPLADSSTLEKSGNTFRIKNSSDKAQGDIFIVGSDGNVDNLPAGTSGQYLETKGSSNNPVWADSPAVPVGAILAWHKSFANTPALPSNFVECNGQTLSDAGSVYNGQVIPNLNGNGDIILSAATSGTTSNLSHTHSVSGTTSTESASAGSGGSGPHSHSFSETSTAGLAGQTTITMVWVMRIK